MNEKKHHGHEQESSPSAFHDQGAPEEAANIEGGQPTTAQTESPELEGLRRELADAQAKSAENLDGWQRAVAEFQLSTSDER